jgi:type II secretory pathway pseudopilin PulG
MSRSANRKEEEGALLLLVMVAAAVMVIGIAVAAQAWSSTWRRDSEDELVFRANQYVDAILAYQKEHGGTLPLELGVLVKPGPRRVRYIRRLFRDPINPNGQWGLLYLMPGGQAIYDPVAAQKGQADAGSTDTASDGMTGSGTGSTGMVGTGMVGAGMSRAGVTPISSFSGMATGGMPPGASVPPALLGKGVQPGNFPPGGGVVPATGGMMPGGGAPFSGVLPPPKPGTGTFDADSPSEPPIGWPIVGVISRVAGKRDDRTFKTYKGKEKVSEWMFHIYDRGLPATQTPGLPIPGVPRQSFVGPGFGNRGPLGGISGDGPGGYNGRGGTRGLGGTGGNGDPNRQNVHP